MCILSQPKYVLCFSLCLKHSTFLYLPLDYVRSSIFKQPNPLSFNITLPPTSKENKPYVPPGISSPKTFVQVGAALLDMLAAEVNHGSDVYLTAWKGRPGAFTKVFQAQFVAYAQGSYPFTTPLGQDEDPLAWWLRYEGTANAGILAVCSSFIIPFLRCSLHLQAIAIKLFSASPHSMAEERTMSVVTLMNSPQRNRQKVESIMAMAQIRGHYRDMEAQSASEGPKVYCSMVLPS